jgi:hypothetical protein
MKIVTITRAAKFKDCKFLFAFIIGKLKRHRCENVDSYMYKKQIRLNDLVCDNWEL